MKAKRREWMEFKIEGLNVYKVTMFYCDLAQSDMQLIAASSKAEAIRIMQTEKRQFNNPMIDFKGHDYRFTAERATVLRPIEEGS